MPIFTRRFIGATLLTAAVITMPLISFAQSEDDEGDYDDDAAPTVTLTINNEEGPITVASGARITVLWTSENVDSCKANWTKKSIRVSGKQAGKLKKSATFVIKCLSGQEEVRDSVRVVVEAAVVPSPGVGSIKISNASALTAVGGHSAQAFTVKIDDFDRNKIDPVKWSNAFYKQYPSDNWDYIAFFTTPIPNPVAYHAWVKNQVKGIGMFQSDDSTPYGSAERLRGIALLFRPGTPTIGTFNILIHEILGHSFGMYLGTELGENALNEFHWSSCADSTAPPGVQYWGLKSWKNNGDGTWTASQAPTRSQRIQRLDPFMLYASGIVAPENVTPMQILVPLSPPSARESDCSSKETITATSRTLAVSDVVAKHGPRIPASAAAQKGFSTAFVLLVNSAETPSADDMAKVAALAAEWPYIVRTALSPVSALPPLVMDLKVDGAREVTVPAGSKVNLSWTSTNATSCDINGSSVALSGTMAKTVGGSEQLFTLTCLQAGGDHVGGTENALVSIKAGSSKPSPCSPLGDVNGDGFVTQADYDLTYEIVGGRINPTEAQKLAADINKNGFINPTDYGAIDAYIQGKLTTFAGCTATAPKPVTADIKANGQDALTTEAGNQITLSYTSANASYCTSETFAAGQLPTSGSITKTTPSVVSDAVYNIACYGAEGSSPVKDTVVVTLTAPPPGPSPEPATFNATYPSFVTTDRQRKIADLYREVLRREPDEGGLRYWDSTTYSIETIRNFFIGSAEYQALQQTSFEVLRSMFAHAYDSGTQAVIERLKFLSSF